MALIHPQMHKCQNNSNSESETVDQPDQEQQLERKLSQVSFGSGGMVYYDHGDKDKIIADKQCDDEPVTHLKMHKQVYRYIIVSSFMVFDLIRLLSVYSTTAARVYS